MNGNLLDKKMLDSFPAKINYVRRASMGVPKTFDIDLSLVVTDLIMNISGNFFYVWDSPDATSYVEIKVNNSREPAIPYVLQTGLETPFDKLLLTVPVGQTGIMTLIYATEAPELLRVIDNRSAISTDLSAILDQLAGDAAPENWNQATMGLAQAQILAANADRKSFSIQAKSTNTGIVYIGFDNTVTSAKWWAELQPGQSCDGDDYLGALHGIATVAGQLIGYAEV